MAINFNQIADDFRRTNWKDPGTWSFLPILMVLVAILVAIPVGGYFALWDPQYTDLTKLRGDEEKLKKDYLAKNGFDPLMGARPMSRLIQDTIRRGLADELLFGRLASGGKVTVDIDPGGKVKLEFPEQEPADIET